MKPLMRDEIAKIARDIGKNRQDMIGWSEPWMISTAEMRVFAIREDDWPLMGATWIAYLVFMDIILAEDYGIDAALVAAERERAPRLFDTGKVISEEDFKLLAAQWVGMKDGPAGKCYCKMRFWSVRLQEMAPQP